MGKTAFSGPVYGAKSELAHFAGTPTTNASTSLIASYIVPVGEDWLLTEIAASCSTCSSGANLLTVKVEGGSTTIPPASPAPGNGSTRAGTLGTATWGTSTGGPILSIVTKDAHEYEGAWAPSGSTLRLVVSSYVNPFGLLNVALRGYTRFRNSTRGE